MVFQLAWSLDFFFVRLEMLKEAHRGTGKIFLKALLISFLSFRTGDKEGMID